LGDVVYLIVAALWLSARNFDAPNFAGNPHDGLLSHTIIRCHHPFNLLLPYHSLPSSLIVALSFAAIIPSTCCFVTTRQRQQLRSLGVRQVLTYEINMTKY
jgi:hypothetical protein